MKPLYSGKMGRILFFIVFLSGFCVASEAQNIHDLNRQKQALEERIALHSKLLDEYKGKKDKEFQTIELLDVRISDRKKLIEVYGEEIGASQRQLSQLSAQLDSLGTAISQAKEEYAFIVCQLSVNKLYRNDVTYLLASESFQEAYRRYLFMQQYNLYRRKQAQVLELKQRQHEVLYTKIAERRGLLQQKFSAEERERRLLQEELSLRQSNVKLIQQKEAAVRKELMVSQRQAKELENKILAIIREAANSKKKDKSSSKAIKSSTGKLTWPVDKGFVVSSFGEHDHPTIKNLKIKNNGIDIRVEGNFAVKSISEGVVSRVVAIPGYNATVIVRHGTVITVYANIINVQVQHDQSIKAGDIMGHVYQGEGKNSGVLHFEIWEGEIKQNPELWLQKK